MNALNTILTDCVAFGKTPAYFFPYQDREQSRTAVAAPQGSSLTAPSSSLRCFPSCSDFKCNIDDNSRENL